MEILPIRIEKMYPPQDDLLEKIKESRLQPSEGDVIAITSKVVSIWQGRCIHKRDIEKDKLIQKEAEYYLDRDAVPGQFIILTMKNGILIPSAGIDTSNSGDYFTLWPDKPRQAAEELLSWLKNTYRLQELGVIITDSKTTPLRRGVTGVAIAWAGFEPVYDCRREKDIFGEELKITQINVPDALSASAVFVMGEGGEQTPIAVIKDAPYIRREVPKHIKEDLFNAYEIPPEEDLFYPLLNGVEWKKGGSDRNTN